MSDKELEYQLLRNEKVFTHPQYGRVRLRRPTFDHEAFIADVRRTQYHRDLRNPDVLSRSELEKIYEQRGMWGQEDSARMSELSKEVGDLIVSLDLYGYKDLDQLLDEFYATIEKLKEHFADDEEALEAVDRYFDLDKTPTARDRIVLRDNATSSEVDDWVSDAEDYRKQIDLLHRLAKVRTELNELQRTYTKLFVDSIESRMDRQEELARIYCCATDADTGESLWESFEDMLRADPEPLEQIVSEMFFFLNGISDEYREILSRHRFIQRGTDTEDSLEDLPDLPQSNSDGESQEPESMSSSEPTE